MGSRPPRQPRVRSTGLDQRDIFKRRALELIRKIHDKDKYAIFHEPVPLDEVPTYAKVIATPMDLGTVRENTSMGVYPSPTELRADLDLIWANCVKFNHPDTIYYKEAVRLRALAGKLFEEFLRYLERDGLPYGPRASAAANKSSGGQLRAGASEIAPNGVPLQTLNQRIRNIARARRKAILDASSNAEPTDAERAATKAANALMPPPDKHQIYDGPYQRVRRFPNSHHASLFPYVHGSNLGKRLQPFPPAWQALGRSQPYSQHQPQPNLTSAQREIEMRYARQYQDFVTRSAPIARRLLATVLDPLAVVEFDAAQLRANSAPDRSGSHEKKVSDVGDTYTKSTPKKRPRHGELPSASTNIDKPEVSLKPASSSVPPPPSSDDLRELRDVLKTHNIDDSFLSGMLNSSQPLFPQSTSAGGDSAKAADQPLERSSPVRMDVDTGTTEEGASELAPESNAERKRNTSESPVVNSDIPKPMDVSTGTIQEQTSAQAVNPSLADSPNTQPRPDGTEEKPKNSTKKESVLHGDDDKDRQNEESIDSETERDADLDLLLRANYETMQNVLRTRALKEMANGEARKDLEQTENEYAAMLKNGITLAAASLPPHLLISKEKAGALLVDMAKETVKRHRMEEEKSASAKKQKIAVSGEASTVAVKTGEEPKALVKENINTNAITQLRTDAPSGIPKTAAPNGHIEPNGVTHGGGGRSNVKATGGPLTTGKMVKEVSATKMYST